MKKFNCPQCQSELTEVLDSDGVLFICRSDFHGKVSPSFTRETLEIAQGITFAPSHPLPVEELVRCQKCNALIETSVHCDNCGTFEPTRR